MARNDLPSNASQLIGLGNKMLAGLNSLGTTLGITQITPVIFNTTLQAFITADGDFNAARSALQAASDGFHETEDTVTTRLQIMRNVLAGRFGSRWSTQWAQAGFINNSTALPRRIEERIGLALSLSQFFTANPSYEVASMGVTANEAFALYDEANIAQQGYIDAGVIFKTKGDADTSATDALTAMMRALIKILGATLAKDDPRWENFGLNMPATNATPGKPQNLGASLDGDADVVVECDEVRLATRYRWRTRLAGSTGSYVLAASTVAPMACLTEVAPGSSIEIIVQAVNVNLQGVASDPVVFAKPALSKASEAKPAAPEAAPLANGNGHATNGNGHALARA